MLLIQGPPRTHSHLYSQTFLPIIWWECRELSCFLVEPLISSCSACSRGMVFRHSGEVRGSPPSCPGDALESTVWVKAVTPSAGATTDGPGWVIPNTTSADTISAPALLPSSPCAAGPGRVTHAEQQPRASLKPCELFCSSCAAHAKPLLQTRAHLCV